MSALGVQRTDRRLIPRLTGTYERPEPLYRGGGKRTDIGKPTKRQLAEKANPSFDWKAYDTAMDIAAKVASSNLNNKNKNYRDTRTEEEKQMAEATIEQGKALILAESPYNDYKSIVDGAYKNAPWMTETSRENLARLAFNFGLNPSPGLDLIYAWVQDNKLQFHISYKAWLALAHRFRKFIITHREITEPNERTSHGLKAGDVGYVTEIIPLDIADDLKQAQAAGFKIDVEQFKIIGYGVARAGDVPPKGRSLLWLAKKRSIKDAALQAVADKFNLASPDMPGMFYDAEKDSWVSADAIEGVYTVSTPDDVTEPDYTPEPAEQTEQAESTTVAPPQPETAGEKPADTTPETAPDVVPENAGRIAPRPDKQLFLGKVPIAIREARDAFIAAGVPAVPLGADELKAFHVEFGKFQQTQEDKSVGTKKAFVEWVFTYTTTKETLTHADAAALRWWWEPGAERWAVKEYAAYAGKLALDAEMKKEQKES